MVAIFSGNGLGYLRGSGSVLGGAGLLGRAALGRGNDNLLVNAATGNLVLNRKDEFLIGIGPDASYAQTYNSQGDPANSWTQQPYHVVGSQTGKVNRAGSTITRSDGDGHSAVYSYDIWTGVYRTTEGGGAHDQLQFANGKWTWTDGDSHATETYTALAGVPGLNFVSSIADADGNLQTLSWDANGGLERITNANGDYLAFTLVNGLPTQVTTYYANAGGTASLTHTRYTWDAQRRLTGVTVDLSPNDNNIADGNVYTTIYTYDGASSRIASVTQTDGSRLDVTYALVGGEYRVATLSQAVSAGVSRTTGFSYDLANRITTITDASGQATSLYYDAGKQLTKVVGPPAVGGGAAQITQFAYNNNGDLIQVTDALGASSSYEYDNAGNLLLSRDALGNTVSRTYGAANELLTETRWLIPDPDGAGAGTAGAPVTTRYIYDAELNLRFVLTAEGRVTEHRYTGTGDLASTLEYSANTYDMTGWSPTATATDNDLATWAAGIADKTTIKRTDMTYDVRGSVTSVTTYTSTLTDGTGNLAAVYSRSTYVYDPGGRLLSRVASSLSGTETFIYDGLGRLLSSTDAGGGTTTVAQADASGTTTTTLANGLTTVALYNKAGELISSTQSNASIPTAATRYKYDSLGHVRMAIDPVGRTRHFLYDNRGRKVADIAADGALREYLYDNDDRLVATVDYLNRLGAAQLASLVDSAGNPTSVTLAAVRPAASAGDAWQWNVYDQADRLIETIDAVGRVTTMSYDGAGRLVGTTSYAATLPAGTVAGFKSAPPTLLSLPGAGAGDRTTRNFYDNDGRLVGVLDGAGALSRIVYDAAGQKVREIGFANLTAPSLRATGTFADLLAYVGTNAGDHRMDYVYDARGGVAYSIDGQAHATKFQTDAAGRLSRTVQYNGSITPAASYSIAYVANQILTLGQQADPAQRVTRIVYDAAGRRAFEIRGEFGVTGYSYDTVGNLVKTTKFASVYPDSLDPGLAAMQSWAASHGADAGNRVTRQVFDALGQIAYQVDGEGYVTEQRYDAAGTLTQAIRYAAQYAVGDGVTKASLAAQIGGLPADAAVTSYAYDGAGRLSDVTDAAGGVTHFVYDALGRTTDTIAAFGTADASTTRSVYDAGGRLIGQTRAYGSAEAATTSYAYDGLDNRLSSVDARGSTATYQYDALGRLLSTTAQVDASTSITTSNIYDSFGQLVRQTDARGFGDGFYYDALGRRTLHVDREGYATRTTYNAFGEVATVVRYAARTTGKSSISKPPTIVSGVGDATTTFTYDHAGRVLTSTDAEGYYEQYGYDAFGQRISVRNRLGGIVTNAYDRRGLLVSETLPKASYDKWGSIIGASVANRFEYDARGNRTKTIEAYGLPEQRITSFVYDKADRLTESRGQAVSVLSQADHVSTSIVTPTEISRYDALGRVIETIDSLGARTLSYYDRLGRKTAQLNGLGTLTTYAYDANGNVATTRVYGTPVALPAAAGGPPPAAPGGDYRQTSFSYDRLDRLTATTIANVRIGGWNGSAYATAIGSVTTTLDYDANGNVIKTTDANGGTVFAFYDKANRKIASVDQENYLTYYIVNADGNVAQEERIATKVTAGVYTTTDPAWLRGTVAGSAADRITQFAYDRNGRRIGEVRLNVLASAVDGAGVLTAGSANSSVFYSYNGAGEVTQKTFANGDILSYDYDLSGRLTRESRAPFTDLDGAVVRPTTSYYYDGLDNLSVTRLGGGAPGASDRYTRYTYGAGGRLAQMTNAAGNAYTYFYDAAGNVVRESYDRLKADGSTVAEALLYSRDLLGRVVAQGLASWTGAWTRGDVQNSAYNAYGEIAQRGLNGGWQEQFAYDGAGRLWRTNSGDGVWRYFVNDANGNQTLAIESEGTNLAGLTIDQVLALATAGGAAAIGGLYIDGINATINLFDRRGAAIQTRLPQRQLSAAGAAQEIVVSRTYNAFGDVASETDARGYTTDLTYNTMGRLTQKQSPLVSYTAENGTVSTARPIEQFYYDAAGRMIGRRDANGNLMTRALVAGTGHDGSDGLIAYEYHADGGALHNAYDVFGDLRVSWDAISRRTDMSYDAMGRLTQLTKPNGLVEAFGYDLLGQRISHWDNVHQLPVYGPPEDVWIDDSYWDPELGWVQAGHWETQNPIIGYEPEKEVTDYDLQGRVTRQIAFGGDTTTISYAWNAAIATGGMGTFGGWTQTTTMANGRTATEQSDMFGHQVSRIDLGGHAYAFTYDLAGRMTKRAGGETISYSWLNTGKVAESFIFTGDYQSQNWTRKGTGYSYDKAGNLLSELMTDAGETSYEYWNDDTWQWETYYDSWSRTYKNATATYDALGRTATWAEAGGAYIPGASTSYEYDLVGNIRRTSAQYRPLDNQGNQASYLLTQDNWYRYDSMDRLVTKGSLVAGQIVRGYAGADYLYDRAGQRVSTKLTTSGQAYVYNPYYNPWEPDGDPYILVYYDAETREDYSYDAGGALTSVRIAQGGYSDNGDGTVTPEPAPGYGALRASFTYDLLGRQTRQIDWQGDGSNAAYDRTVSYNGKGQAVSETVISKQGWDTITTYTNNDYGYGAGYALGAIVSSGSSSYKNNSYQTYSTTTNSYVWFDGAVQSQIAHRPNSNQSTTYYTSFYYDASGVLTSIYVGDGRARSVSFVNDANGQAIKRDESDNNWANGDPHEIWHRFGGKQMGSVGNNGTLDSDYATSITNRTRTPGNGAFRFGATWGAQTANFDLSNEAITSYSQGVATGSYTVRSGETLETIAAGLWGDSSLWYKLAEANGMSGANGLIEGQRITIPVGVMKNRHNASTFKPFDPSETLGDVNPTTPTPTATAAKKNKCGILGSILLVVIAVAVTAITAGAAVAALSPAISGLAAGMSAVAAGTTGLSAGALIGIGAASGALGSIASQGVGVATGIQESFSWKAVGLAAVGGAVGAGVGASGAFSKIANPFLRGLISGASSSVLTQGIGVATGLQDKFDWAGVAAAGLSGGVSSALNTKLGSMNKYAAQLISGGAGAIASAAARSLITGTDFGDNLLAALPDVIGTTIGNAISDAVAEELAEDPVDSVPDQDAVDETVALLNQQQQLQKTEGIQDTVLRYRIDDKTGQMVLLDSGGNDIGAVNFQQITDIDVRQDDDVFYYIMPAGTEIFPIVRLKTEAFTDTATAAMNKFGLDLVINGPMYEFQKEIIPYNTYRRASSEPIPQNETTTIGQLVALERVVAGRSAPETFYFAKVKGENGTTSYQFGYGDPPLAGTIAAVGGGIPLLINNLMYGSTNLYSGHPSVIAGAPTTGDPGGYWLYTTQRSNAGYASFVANYEKNGNVSTGKTIIAANPTDGRLLVIVQADGAKKGRSLATLQAVLRQTGFTNAIMLDGSTSSMALRKDGTYSASPATRKNNTIGTGVGFRLPKPPATIAPRRGSFWPR